MKQIAIHLLNHSQSPYPLTLPHTVVFVVFGNIPMYLHMNIELARRNNAVVVITDSIESTEIRGNQINPASKQGIVIFEPLSLYDHLSERFRGIYRHRCKDKRQGRQEHELQCIQRWLVRVAAFQTTLRGAIFIFSISLTRPQTMY